MNGMNMLVGKEWSVGYFFESDHTHQQLQALGLLELAQKWLLQESDMMS